MISLSGAVLFKLYMLSTLHELYTQSTVVPELQNSQLNTMYKCEWINNCSQIFQSTNVSIVLEIVEFCLLLIQKFSPSHRQIFNNNKNFKAQAFNYNTRDDLITGFSIRTFLKFLRRMGSRDSNNKRLKRLRDEIIDLLRRVEYIQQETASCKNLMIQFRDYKQYRNLFEHLSVQYKFVDDDNISSTLVYIVVDAATESLKYKIEY